MAEVVLVLVGTVGLVTLFVMIDMLPDRHRRGTSNSAGEDTGLGYWLGGSGGYPDSADCGGDDGGGCDGD